MSSKVAVIYYSATGTVHGLASAVADGAESAGAEVRLRRVAELAPKEAIAESEKWHAHHEWALAAVAEASHEDLEWADAYAFGTPTRFGNVSAQLKQFIDSTGPLWSRGVLAGKPVTVFTAASNLHGGQESTVLSLSNVFYHWGAVLVPPGYTDDAVFAAGGNPYGASVTDSASPDDLAKACSAASYQGARLAEIADALVLARVAKASV